MTPKVIERSGSTARPLGSRAAARESRSRPACSTGTSSRPPHRFRPGTARESRWGPEGQ